MVEAAKERIKTFDAVRAVATLLVFLFHAGSVLPVPQDNFFNLKRLQYFTGTVGVSVFFVLSGFLLFYQMAKTREPLDKEKLWKYVKNRLLRILPLYYFSIVLIVLLRWNVFFTPEGLKAIIYNLFFFRGFRGHETITIDLVYWTLIIEMHFYIFLPVFYHFFYKIKKAWPFLGLIGIGLLYRILVVKFFSQPSIPILRLTPANLDFFALGMLGAYLFIYHREKLKLFSRSFMQFISVVLIIAVVRFYDLEFARSISYLFAPIVLGSAILINILSLLLNEKSFYGRIMTSRFMIFIAMISYSMYIWHPFTIDFANRLFPANGIAEFSLGFVFTVGASFLSYYCLERPFLVLKDKVKKNIFLPFVIASKIEEVNSEKKI